MKEKEHQSIEWKESWQDEYLKWICGYANAYGGTIYIGTDDDGNVVGIDNARDLLERIPNKITDTMGIIADVNLLYKGKLEYLQIIVDKYPSLISFRGKYYYRSGSTMREITGKELERALLKTQGRTWDGVPLPKLTVADLKQDFNLTVAKMSWALRGGYGALPRCLRTTPQQGLVSPAGSVGASEPNGSEVSTGHPHPLKRTPLQPRPNFITS